MAEFYTILTNLGLAKINAAVANNENLILKNFAIGDGNGVYVTPNPNQTQLVNELYRNLINSVTIHAENANWLEIICVIPIETGGFTIREVGLFDEEGDLIAVTKHPATYKPLAEQGTAKELFIKNIIAVENASDVTITFDNYTVYVTKEYVDSSDSKKVDKVEGKGLSDTNYTQAEKSKLVSVEDNANNYLLPKATAAVLGGVKNGSNIDNVDGVLSVKNASTSAKGVVQLDDTTTSTSTATAPTSRALKELYEGTAWQTPVFLNGYTDGATSRYKKVGSTLHLQINARGTAIGADNPIFNLPSAYRPTKTLFPTFTQTGAGTTIRGSIDVNGNVFVSAAASEVPSNILGFIIHLVVPL